MRIPLHVSTPAAALAIALAQLWGAAAQDAGQNVFRGETTLVPVDVRVLDKQGRPVTDLKQSDFTVLENDIPQDIRHFETQAFTAENAAPASAARRQTVDADADVSPHRRVFLILLGRGDLQVPAEGVDGMIHLVRERLLPQDLVAVMAWNRASDFTTDHERAAALLERFKKNYRKVEAEMAMRFSGLAAIYGSREIPAAIQKDVDTVFGSAAFGSRRLAPAPIANADRIDEDTRRTTDLLMGRPSADVINAALANAMGVTLDEFASTNVQTMQDVSNLYTAIEYLRHIDGEKHLLLLSAQGITLPRYEDDRDLARVASDARVVLDVIQTQMTSAVQTFSLFAKNTGGRFFANKLKTASVDADYIEAAARFEYVLGYYPAARWDGKYRKIAVKVNRPGLTVLYRDGYYARQDRAPFDRRGMLTYVRVAAAANYLQPIPDVQVHAAVSLDRSSPKHALTARIDIDASQLAFHRDDAGRNVTSVEVAVFCVRGGDDIVGQSWQTMELTFSDGKLDELRQSGLHHTVTVPVTSDPQDVKVVIYNFDADLVGSLIVKVPKDDNRMSHP